jgi:hypothetical protein
MVRRRTIVAFALALLAAAAGSVRAQDARPPAAPGGDDVPPPSRVYVPFEDLKKVFEKEGQGVFVPYAEFRELWKKAMDRGPGAASPSGVTTALYEGKVEGDLAMVEATLEVVAASDGESSVPIGLAGATIGAATLDGKPAAILVDKGGARVVVRGKGAHSLKATLVAPVLPRDGDRTVAFPSAGAPVSRLSFTVPGEGVRVTVEPNLATTRTDAGSGVTQVMAYVGAAPEMRLTWRPKPVETAGTAAILQAQTEVLHRIGEQTVETRLFARFTILRGGMRTFRVRFPAGERVLSVEGSGIRVWEETEEAGSRDVRVDLHNDAEGLYDLRLQLERPRAATDTTAELPALVFPGSSREAGTVAVQVLPPIAVRPATVEGMYRVPTDDLSEWMRTGFKPLAPGVTVLAWRYAGGARRLSVSVETVAPEVSVAERSVVAISPGSAVLRAALDLTVERAGLFQTTVTLPDGWTLESAHVREGDAMRALDARVEGEGAARRLLVDLGTRRTGAVPLLIVLRRPLAVGDVEETLALPVLVVDGAVRSRGVLAVAAEEALDVRTGAVTGFVAAEPGVLAAANLPPESSPPPQPRPVVFGFRHAGEERSGTLTLVRRKPLVVAEAVTVAGVEEDRLKLRHAIRFLVRYAGVDTFRFSLPKAVTERVRIDGAAVKERTHAADPDDSNREIHTVVLQAPALGQTLLSVEYDLPQEPLAVGGSRKIDVPALRVLGVEREQGWYAVTRDPALSVEGDAKGLVYADAREVPPWAGAADAFLVWRRLSQPHGLTLSVAKHEPVPILQAVVNALALDTLVGGGAVALTEARMDVQVNGLQYLRVELPANAKIESTEVDNRPVSPRVEKGVLLLPCPPGKSRDDRFGVRIVYREEAPDATGKWFTVSLVAPRIPDALVQATAWTTWVPPDSILFSGGGNLRPAQTPSILGAVLDAVGRLFGARQADGRPTSGGALPPQVTLNVAGRSKYGFQRTGEDANLDARFLPVMASGAVAAVLGVAVLGIAWFLARRGISAGWTALVAIALGLVLHPSAAPGWRASLTAIVAAGVALAVASGLRSWWGRRRDDDSAAAPAPAPVDVAPVTHEPPAADPTSGGGAS